MQNILFGKKNVHFDEFLLPQTKKVVILQRKSKDPNGVKTEVP